MPSHRHGRPGDRDYVIRIDPERVTGRLLRGAVNPISIDERGHL